MSMIEEIIDELSKQNIKTEKLIFKGEVFLELYNLKGQTSFNFSQLEFIKEFGARFNVNMNKWLLPLGIGH